MQAHRKTLQKGSPKSRQLIEIYQSKILLAPYLFVRYYLTYDSEATLTLDRFAMALT